MTNDFHNPEPQQEPSVLDYFKSLFRFGGGQSLRSVQPLSVVERVEEPKAGIVAMQSVMAFPWRSVVALLLALIGQNIFEPPTVTFSFGYVFYIAAIGMLGWAIQRGEWNLTPHKPVSEREISISFSNNISVLIRGGVLLVSILLAGFGFILFGENLFTPLNTALWLLSMILFISALWERPEGEFSLFSGLRFNFNSWTLLLIAATAVVFFFRFYQTQSLPPEPFSDHAEKLFDVYDVSTGITRVFFPRNTGREAIQMYWTLFIANTFGTGLSYLSLKLGTAIIGFLTLPFIYLLGKEVGGQRVGLFAFFLAGIGYWPNVISRVGLRFPLYPMFVAPTLFFLIRGLRTRNRNDFLLSGLFLGIGLHGYSPMRIIPIVIIVAFILYWLHGQSKGVRSYSFIWLVVLGMMALVVFVPLLRYWYEEPASFGFRAFSRLSGTETPLPGPAHEIFFSNVWNALRMFNFDDGEIWVHSVPHRPALDVVSAALFALGLVLVFVRYLRNRHWLDLFLLLSIPLLQLPSTLSLAYPAENPALNRAGGAYIPAFIIGAMALDGLLTSFGGGKMRNVFVWGVSGLLLLISSFQNYDLVFDQYYTLFRNSSWNTSDMGQVIRDFEREYGTTDTVWIVPYPHWVDTRLPAVWAGIPNHDMAMWRDSLESTTIISGPKEFLVRANLDEPESNDIETINILRELYPNGILRLFDSDLPGHDFWIYFVPGN